VILNTQANNIAVDIYKNLLAKTEKFLHTRAGTHNNSAGDHQRDQEVDTRLGTILCESCSEGRDKTTPCNMMQHPRQADSATATPIYTPLSASPTPRRSAEYRPRSAFQFDTQPPIRRRRASGYRIQPPAAPNFSKVAQPVTHPASAIAQRDAHRLRADELLQSLYHGSSYGPPSSIPHPNTAIPACASTPRSQQYSATEYEELLFRPRPRPTQPIQPQGIDQELLSKLRDYSIAGNTPAKPSLGSNVVQKVSSPLLYKSGELS
jgi:hypothetical protein